LVYRIDILILYVRNLVILFSTLGSCCT